MADTVTHLSPNHAKRTRENQIRHPPLSGNFSQSKLCAVLFACMGICLLIRTAPSQTSSPGMPLTPEDESTTALLKALWTGNSIEKTKVLMEISRQEGSADVFIVPIAVLLTDQDEDVRDTAGTALEYLNWESFHQKIDDEVVAILSTSGCDPRRSRSACAGAIRALSHLGEQGRNSAPDLASALQSMGDDPELRAVFAHAIGRLGCTDKAVVDVLVSGLKDRDRAMRFNSADALKRLRIREEYVLVALIEALGNERNYYEPLRTLRSGDPRMPMAQALWEAGESGQNRLLDFLQSAEIHSAVAVARGVGDWNVDENNPLVALMDHPHPRIRLASAGGALVLCRDIEALITAAKGMSALSESPGASPDIARLQSAIGIIHQRAIQNLETLSQNSDFAVNSDAKLILSELADEKNLE